MRHLLRDNGLTLALSAMFVAALIGMALTGHASRNQELAEHGRAAIGLGAYLSGGVFLSALFENWESEFLQMAVYVVLTAMLFQRGSAESRDPDAPQRDGDEVPWRDRHPILAWLYERSLGIALAVLFGISFVLHWWFSMVAANHEAMHHGRAPQSALEYIGDAQLWFESFQNWQSEFLSTAVLVVLSIFLRHRGSPESKPAAARNDETGA
ncbi:hypothetical protein J2X48_005189 [Bosea sp. BE271]|uniref:DUF6766 family protein n=1 Tax=Bosea TaxID=85413 RepID=UPI00285A8753|nr:MULTISPECIES: DUF6766 family protein [Bosea]MDR6831514.1 hypothetical protein [Bosea robiniae]MDR6898223.1 hypothetical protein [Bosea sp. BE109]MDR7141620.1 hypothetical protein [Bosea sp. BE168]MDR7178236.1 hypothetical protein [Bosea sp. BE271]